MTQEFLQASAEALARAHTKEAIGAAVEILRDRSAFPADRLRAAQMILDRGHGKPTSVSIQVPAKKATVAQLINMSDDQLMAIVASRQRNAQVEGGTENLPARWVGHDVVEGELLDPEDPTL